MVISSVLNAVLRQDDSLLTGSFGSNSRSSTLFRVLGSLNCIINNHACQLTSNGGGLTFVYHGNMKDRGDNLVQSEWHLLG